MAHIHVLDRFVENEIRVVFVYCVVSEMHILILQILRSWSSVLLGCESGQTLLIHKNPQRVNAGNQDIDSEIEFKSFYQVWFVEVALDYATIAF